MTLESMETLNDEQLRTVIARAGELLKQHDRERKDKALADARSILASAGLSLDDVAGKRRSVNARKSSDYHRGRSDRQSVKTGTGLGNEGTKPLVEGE